MAFCKQSAVTEVLTQTLCPTWDQTLIFDNVEIYESVENIAKSPPSVVVEVFDKDTVVSLDVIKVINKVGIPRIISMVRNRFFCADI